MTQVSVQNHSTKLTNSAIQAALPAFQQQLDLDYAPLWGATATLTFDATPPVGAWTMGIYDTSDMAGAGGYHETTRRGKPEGKVFLDSGLPWSVVFSHELLEMMGDPEINLASQQSGGTFFGYENCDAVEQNTYTIAGVEISDFVTPRWFIPSLAGQLNQRYDFLRACSQPGQLLSGGYISVWSGVGGWTQKFASSADAGYLCSHARARKKRK